MMIENKIVEILMKEASNKLSSEEQNILSDFVSKSAVNSAFVNENRSILNVLPDFEGSASMFHVDSALVKVKAQMEPSAIVHELKPLAKSKAIIWQRLAAAAAVLIGLSTLAYLFLGSPASENTYTAVDKTEIIQLTDGSEVVLNKNSRLILSDEFGSTLRDMRLEGEAYFKVKNNNDQPFTVKTGAIEVEVLGTEFNINNEGDVNVFVEEGKVKVSALNTGTKVLLTAGESANFNKSSKALLKDKSGRINATSWMSNKLRFDAVPLAQAVKEIENHFDIKISLDNKSLENCKYTSLFNGAEVDEVLETLSAVFNVQIVKKGSSTFQLMGGSCN